MAQFSCPECGRPLYGNEATCPECGISLNWGIGSGNRYQHQITLDEGDNDAEEVLRNYLNYIRKLFIILSVIFAVVSIFVSIGFGVPEMAIPFVLIGVIGVVLAVVISKLLWSIGMIFINLSTNVRIIKHKIK